MQLPLMVFAAGFGTRMQPLTNTMPKPLIPVAGKPLIRHALDPAYEAGLSPIVVNAHYKADMIATHLRDDPVHLQNEQPEVLETGGGMKKALPLLGQDPVATMNSDAVWDGPNPFEVLKSAWDPTRMEALVLCCPIERCLGRTDTGDFTLTDGHITRGPGVVYVGAQIIKTDRVSAHPEPIFSFNVLWDQMIQDRTLFGVNYPGRWCDVGRPSSIPLAEGMLNG